MSLTNGTASLFQSIFGRTASLYQASGGTDWGCENLQGAREYNEDKFSVVSKNAGGFYKKVFGVHDGHGGMESVNLLVSEFVTYFRDRSRLSGNPELDIANFYSNLKSLLVKETSGVVSVICVVKDDDSLFWGWLGDCEGSLFTRDGSIVQGSFHEKDIAKYVHTGGSTNNFVYEHSSARTRPHCLGKHVVLDEGVHWRVSHESMSMHALKRTNVPQEVYISVEGVTPLRFEDPDAQYEYQMIKLKNRDINVLLDVSKVKLGIQYLTVDTRLSLCVQPTRSLGDASIHCQIILREPSILPVGKAKAGDYAVLCSDGMFHSGAFADMAALVKCIASPLSFAKRYFYHDQQEVSLRMKMIMKSMPVIGSTWKEFVTFLRSHHFETLKSVEYIGTHHASNISHYKRWLTACDASITWFENHVYAKEPTIQSSSLNIMSSMVAHLAIIMGSSDNVTVLIAQI